MSFFDSIPLPEPPEPRPRQPEWAEPDAAEIPVSLGLDLTLAVSETAALYVSRVAAYSNGVTFDLVAVQRRTDLGEPEAIHRYGFHGVPPGGPELPPDFLRFGVELSDGLRLTNLGAFPPSDADPDGFPVAVLLPRGGGGHGGLYRQEWWLWPLPTTGDLKLVCEWPAFDIPQSHATISGSAIRDAASRATAIWPSTPPE